MNICITALLSLFPSKLSDSKSTQHRQFGKKSSFLPGIRAAVLSQLAIIAALAISVPALSAQVTESNPDAKPGGSELLRGVGSTKLPSPTVAPKTSPHAQTTTTAPPVSGITINEYSVDGTNSGTARLGRNVTLGATAPGQSNPTFTWSVQGAGTITTAGIYTAPTTMPTSNWVTVTATLVSNTAITGTYTFQLIYTAPTVLWVTPSTLLAGETNSVLVGGSDFTAATTVTVGGVSLPAVFKAPSQVQVQIPIAAGATTPISIVASNPTPGGGSSAVASAPVKAPTMTLGAYSVDGANSGTARLGRNVTVTASVAGLSSPGINWSVQGAGTISAAGVYTAPTTMPSNGSVTITGSLASYPAVSASYNLALIYTAPTISWVIPATLTSGQTNSVSLGGADFTSATTVKVGGATVPVTFQAPNGLIAQIPVAAGATSALSIVASNPTPGGGTGAAVSAPVQAPGMTIAAYSADGTNTGTARLGRNVTIDALLATGANATVNWSVQGGGTITSAGIYTAPAAMPSSGTVIVTAELASNTAVSASYTMQLMYNAPTIHWLTPSVLTSGQTNAIQVGGLDFTAATTVTVNGTPVPVVYNGSTAVVAQIPVAAGSLTAVSIVASNPTPGGGTSAAVSGPITPLAIALSSFSTAAVNPASASLGQSVQYTAVVSGGNTAVSWPVTWSVMGGGTITATGLYQSPSQMPASANVVVTATLAANSTVSASSSLALLDPTPVVNRSQPVQATAGATATFTFYGENFNSGTVIEVNGTPVATSYLSPTSVSAAVTTVQAATGSLSITAVNPAQSGGQGAAFSLSIGDNSSVQAVVSLTPGRTIPGDFVGLSHEWGMQTYMGTAATGVNNIYRQLIKNLTNPGYPFFIRIGGASTDSQAAPTATTLTAFSELATAMPVKFSLGVNLADDNLSLTEGQVSYFVAHMPSGSLEGIELGNEPDSYPGAGLRPASYNYTGYFSDLANFSAALMPLLPANVKLMGPSFNDPWHLQENMVTLEAQEANNMSIVSAHYAAGYQGTTNGVATVFPANYLLLDSTVTSQISTFKAIATAVHNKGQIFRIGETNTIDEGGVAGISNSFSSALYVADMMFAEATAGADGVNWHGTSGCYYCPFTFGIQNENGMTAFSLQQVNPIYYGLLFFHDATANSAQLLPVSVTAATPVNVKVWSTVDASGTVHVAILNKDETFTGNITVTVPGYGSATAIRMVAPNYKSEAGVTIGGQTFDNSFDGNPIGTAMTESFSPTNSVYTIPVQPTSAVLLTLTK